MSFPYEEIEEKIGYAFRDRALLKQAFTHSTYGNLRHLPDNERLEYLGDAVLELVVTEWQYQTDKGAEGQLSAERQKMVCRGALDSAVDGLGIYPYLLLSGKEQNRGDKAKSNLFEAVVAAIYIDGGYLAAKRFILRHGNVEKREGKPNYKGDLQEFLQARGEKPPVYATKQAGKDNFPYFYCEARAMGESAEGSGKNRKEAEIVAASRLLWELRERKK